MDKDDHATSCRHQADCLPFVLVHQCLSVLLKEALIASLIPWIYYFEDLGMHNTYCVFCVHNNCRYVDWWHLLCICITEYEYKQPKNIIVMS